MKTTVHKQQPLYFPAKCFKFEREYNHCISVIKLIDEKQLR